MKIRIEKNFESGCVCPLGRGILLGDEYLNDIVEYLISKEGYRPLSGSILKGIHLLIEIEDVIIN